jgi:hypothetical protein
MTLFLDLEDTIFDSAPHGNLEMSARNWKPIENNIKLIQKQVGISYSKVVVLSYAISTYEEEMDAIEYLTPQIKEFFPYGGDVIHYLAVRKLCAIWKQLFYTHIDETEFCSTYTKEMVIQTLFLRKPQFFTGAVSYFFDDCVTSHTMQFSDKLLRIHSVPKPLPYHVKSNQN